MRASEQEQTGGAGASEVSAAFERLGWGPVENNRHDLGTDLFVQVRDERGYDLGLIVGAQVKTGPSYFTEPERDATGRCSGWWYRDSDRSHVDAWLSHSLPHLIVLHDLQTRTSYWAHVTLATVISTGKGAKVFVPCTQTVDVAHRDALLAVAGAHAPGVSWEGSVWSGGQSLLPRDQLRYALLVPRLIAPHPNMGRAKELSPVQAVAMLVQARLSELDLYTAAHPMIPSLTEARGHHDWGWRFYAAMFDRVTEDETSSLIEAIDHAQNAAQRVAATATAASALVEACRSPEAIALLDAALSLDEAGPADHAWLLVQRARAHAEIGSLRTARADALGAQGIRMSFPNDATARAIAGAAAVLLFNTSAWGQRDLEEVVTSSDTTANWWRAQTTSQGLGSAISRSYKLWAQDPSVSLGGEDNAGNRLYAAALTASHCGEQGTWRRLSGLRAQDDLLQTDRWTDHSIVGAGLSALRLAGDDRALALGVRRAATDGPAPAVTQAAAQIDLETSTKTTGLADLSLLQRGGDLLDGETAARSVDWLLGALTDSSSFADRTTPSYLLELKLIEALAATVQAADIAVQRRIVERVLGLPTIDRELEASAWATVIRRLPSAAWTRSAAVRADQVGRGQFDDLRLAFLRVAAEHDPACKREIIEECASSLNALAAISDVRDLPISVVEQQVGELAEEARAIVLEARRGQHTFGVHDPGSALVLLCLWHPTAARWDAAVSLLAEDAVSVAAKQGALRTLTNLSDRVPPAVSADLIPIARRIGRAEGRVVTDIFGESRDVAAQAMLLAVALGGMSRREVAELVAGLLTGDSTDRRSAALLVDRARVSHGSGVLTSLAGDPDPRVRAAAAQGLVSLVLRGRAGALARRALDACIGDPGALVPESVAAQLRATGGSLAERLLIPLRHHASARVRNLAVRPESLGKV